MSCDECEDCDTEQQQQRKKQQFWTTSKIELNICGAVYKSYNMRTHGMRLIYSS